MQLLRDLLRWFGLADENDPEVVRSFAFDEELVHSLQMLARQQNRTAGELAAELLAQAVAEQRAGEYYILCWESLTPREQQVAALVCQGYTNPQIGARLHLSPETIKTHTRGILRKFSLRSKAELRQVLQEWDFGGWE